ncbi:MAG: restriction endonuclease subunit S [Gammaproteobacteria bacterium]|nr:restriction endonuclease subunit S [Gammaproteobacteria bacterium]
MFGMADASGATPMNDLRPYPRIKDSGVEWLGEVPAHWEVRQLGRIGRVFKGNGGTKADEADEGTPCVRYGDLYTNHRFHITETRSRVDPLVAQTAYTSIQYGDVLFAGSGETIEEIGKSAANLMRCTACCGGDVIVFRPNRAMNPAFLGYATDCLPTAQQKAQMGRGFTVMHIYGGDLKRLNIAVPPAAEQAAIARYLDHATGRIDHQIRAKEKLIALLEEQKATLVKQAVTGQTNVRTGRRFSAYKASGLDWLGGVPEHWQMIRNGRLFAQRNETGRPELPILEVSLRSGIHVRDFENSNRKQVLSDRSLYKRVAKGDIAYNMMRMWQGAVGVAPTDGLVSPAYVVAKPMPGIDSRYFDHLFHIRGYMTEVDRYSRGIVKDRNRLYWEDFKQMPTPCPPSDEQAAIADAVEDQTAATSAYIRNVRSQISLAHEYRTRLVADVATGKLDVRDAAERLPNEPEDPGTLGCDHPLAEASIDRSNLGGNQPYDREEAIQYD